jgi:hypothetical protein
VKIENQKQREGLLEIEEDLHVKFNLKPIRQDSVDAYRLVFYSSMGYGKSIQVTKERAEYLLTVKCKILEEANSECQDYKYVIGESDWIELDNMINEFDFWDEPSLRSETSVLDGFGYFLEAKRLEANGKENKFYKAIFRGSPKYDKIGSLCENILAFEDQLHFRFTQDFR